VRSFFRPCDENSIRADTLVFRASQFPFRAGKNPFVRLFSDLCEENASFFEVFGQIRVVKSDS
jgi:hypothetical protein